MAVPNADWFALGLHADLATGLDRILRQEQTRLQFTAALKAALANPLPHAPDLLRLIHDDVKALEKTLRLRVGLLPLDKPQAWFRGSSSTESEKSPIAAAAFHEPIFMPFDEAHALTLRQILPEFWKQGVVATDRFDPGSSLWGRLLVLNKRLHRLNALNAPFQDIALDELPEAIPDELNSPALTQFGQQITQRFKACRADLDACFALLWARSESFLFALHVQHMAQKARGTQRPTAGQDNPSKSAGQDLPPLIPKRRLSPLEEALYFMSFSRLPSFTDLRLRYRAMAQALHPDRGGNEERFKLLTLHYQALLKQLQRF